MTPTVRSARREPLGEHAQHDALAGARITVDQGEAALAQIRLLDAPAEVRDLRREVQRFAGYLGGERIELQTIEGQEFWVHAAPSCEL